LHLTNCDKLQEEIDEKLKNLFGKEKRFMSHLTIARVKNIQDKEKFLSDLKAIKVDSMKFTVDKFNLKSSILKPEGPVYEDLQIYQLD
jgi:2'-5' RNA ligase